MDESGIMSDVDWSIGENVDSGAIDIESIVGETENSDMEGIGIADDMSETTKDENGSPTDDDGDGPQTELEGGSEQGIVLLMHFALWKRHK